jgi:hypothetical protein
MFVASKDQIAILAAMDTQRVKIRRAFGAAAGIAVGMTTVGVLSSGFALIVAAGGCIPGSVSGDSPDGQTTTVKTSLACSETPSGCLCASRPDQADDLTACSGTSVAVHGGEQGVCCGVADVCTCDAFACRSDLALGFCQCGSLASFGAALDGPAIAACPGAGAGDKCCLSTDTRVCICSSVDCEGGATVVPSCTLAMVAVCGADQQSSVSCK